MALLDRFRRLRPAWEDPDPSVRAEAVRALRSQDAELIAGIFRDDADPLVRRAALRKLDDVAQLVEAARGDADPGIREEAAVIVMRMATESGDAAAATLAAASVSEPRSLAALARSARVAAVRESALERLRDERLLAAVAKTADDPGIRGLALERVLDPSLRAEVALKSEHRDVATAALEGVTDSQALSAIAEHARAKAASRRARALLDAIQPPPMEPAGAEAVPEAPDESPEERATREAREHALTSRELLIARAQELAGEDLPAQIEGLRASWTRLPPLDDPGATAIEARFDHELAGVQARRERTAREASEAAKAEEERQAREQAQRENAERQRAETQHRGHLTGICERAQALAKTQSPALRDVERSMRDVRMALEDKGPLGAIREREGFVERLKAARSLLYPRLQELREADEWKRWANTQVQEELVGQMEALVHTTDLEKAAHELRELNERWQNFSQARKDEAQALWSRFRTAREALQARLDEHHEQKAAQEALHLERMLDLCAQAEALADSTDWLKTASKIIALQAEWKQVGTVPHREQRKAWERFHGACDRFFSARKQDLDRRKQDWSRNQEAKEALIQRAEALTGSSDWEQAAAEIRKLQAEWKAVGPVKKSKSEALWQHFRSACDSFFERYKRRDEIANEEQAVAAQALLSEIESLLPPEDGASAPEGLASRLLELLGRWRQTPLPGAAAPGLQERVAAARDRLIELWPVAFQGTELDPEANRLKREKLVARVEAIALAQAGGGAESSVSLADRLREALATNSMGGRAVAEARWREAANEIEQADAAWKRIGPVFGETGRALAVRFEKACKTVLVKRPR